jgi:ArsR family transcriptional regulator
MLYINVSAYADNKIFGEQEMKGISQLFKAFSDESRLRIINLLLQGELCICNLMDILEMPQSKVSRHMAYLKHSGIVDDRREGIWVYYSLCEPKDRAHASILQSLESSFSEYDVFKHDLEKLRQLKLKDSCVS